MKKFVLIGSLMIAMVAAQAQDYTNAVKYNQSFNIGDARYSAMGGAFSALGNNHSSIFDNPGAIGVFHGNSFEFSLNNGTSNSTTSFLDASQKNNTNMFNGNIGLLFKMELPDNELNAKYLNFSYSSNRVADYNINSGFTAYNNKNSMTDELLGRLETGYTNAITDDALSTGLIYKANNNYNSDFIQYDNNGARVYNPYGSTQTQALSLKGRKNEYSYGMGTNFDNKLYLGISLNVSSIDYTEDETYTESDTKNISPSFNSFTMYRKYEDIGRGVGYKIGLIALPVKDLRIAASYHSPVNWNIDRTTQTNMDFYYTQNDSDKSVFTNNPKNESSYKLNTPAKFVLGLAYTFNKTLIISADYENMNYSNAQLSNSDGTALSDANKEIAKNARMVSNLKFGTELRMGAISLRAGTAFYQSPYDTYKDGYTLSYSGGIGLKDENFYIDLAVVNSKTNNSRYLYSDYSGNNVLSSTIKSSITNVILTLGLKF